MPQHKDSANTVPPCRLVCRVLLSLTVAVCAAAAVAFLFVGRWLVIEDPLQKAQAIVVLSGGIPERAAEAARLYREGYASKILLTHPAEPSEALEALGISYTAEDFYSIQVLVHQGVPQDAIEVVAPPIRNTADEISAISKAMSAPTAATVIVVTSKPHTRRVRLLSRRLVPARIRVLVRAADDPFNPRRWWATSSDALDVVREVLGILNAWAGFPLHPSN